MSAQQCKSCGAEQTDRFCPVCGEERLRPELRSAGYIVKQLFTELTDLNGKFWLTFKTLFLKPGVIDHDYSIGRRKIYVKPITLFLVINVIFVMFSTLSDFYVNFSSQLEFQIYSGSIKSWIIEYVNESGWTIQEFNERYNQLVKVLARSLIIIQVPFFALFMGVICYQKQLYSGDYLTFSLNYHSCLLMLFLVSAYIDKVFFYINQTEILPFQFKNVIWFILYGGVITYLIFALRRMFNFNWWQLAWRIPVIVVAYYLSHFAYRFVQLLITISLIEPAPLPEIN